MSFSEIRTLLLSQQTKCLSSSIDTCLQNHSISSSVEYTVARLQVALQSLNTSTSKSTSHAINISPSFIQQQQQQQQQAMEEMNDTARTTFCYFVLWSELHYDEVCHNRSALTNSPSSSPRTLISSSSNTTGSNNNNHHHHNCMKSSDVLEFCGLCRTAVRISDVMRYLQHGTPIFPNIQMLHLSSSSLPSLPPQSPECTFQFPQQRLQYLQRLFLRAMGYDPDYGTQLIQEMFYNNKQHDESSMEHIDANVLSVFRNMEQLMEQTLNDITNKLTMETFHGTNQTNDISNDTNTDGVTRIVGVTYSEKYIDAETGQDIMTIHPNDHTGSENHAPQSLTMNDNDDDDDDDDTFLTTAATAAPNTNDNDSATHPTNTNNRSTDETWKRQAAELEQEILGELLSMREEERDMKLQMIHRVVQTVMDHARSLPEQQDRISYLTQLDYTTQRCLCMKKIWDTMLEQNDQQVPRTMY